MKAQHSVKIQKLAAMIAFSEGKSYNSLKGQSKRIRSPWRYREGPGFRGDFTHKSGKWDEIDQFLKECNLPQLPQYETDNFNSPTAIKGMKFLI